MQGTIERTYNLSKKVSGEKSAKAKDIMLNPTIQFKHSRIKDNLYMFKQSLMKNSDMAQNALMKKGGVYQTAVVKN